MKSDRVIIFTKVPVIGFVKSRLIPVIGAKKACELYNVLLERTIQEVLKLPTVDIQLWCYPYVCDPYLQLLAHRYGIDLFVQKGVDLGERMHDALKKNNQTYTILIGCDCLKLTAHLLTLALDKLKNGVDAVIGPASDGGYYLIAIAKSAKCYFTGIAWGTNSVYPNTIGRFKSNGLDYFELDVLSDLDRPEDLFAMRDELKNIGLNSFEQTPILPV